MSTEPTLGDTVRTMRKQSPYKDLRSFAGQAGVSHEGLRKIEIGKNIPTRETLEKLIKAGRPPRKQAEKMRRDRDEVQASSSGLSRPSFSAESIAGLSQKLVKTTEQFLNDCDLEIGASERRALLTRFTATVREELSA